MSNATFYTDVLQHFADRPIVTIATGATCAYLGDERNLREFLVADETARALRQAGHTVFSLLFDDSLDPLNYRQLRVAVNKDEKLLQHYEHWCGKPIALLPDPWECHQTYAEHFESQLLDRLHCLGCYPTLISTAALYRGGVYAPHVADVLTRSEEVLAFLQERFAGYQPDKLFWPLCPACEYIDETRIERVVDSEVRLYCRRCERAMTVALADVRGKLNWKLDCALRWALFHVDAEPFNKAYLEPQAGSFYVAQALSQRFFHGPAVFPLHYGLVKMDKALGYKLLPSLPGSVLRTLLVERPSADLTLTNELVMTAASRYEALPCLSYLDFVKQVLPMWLLTPQTLNQNQRDLVARGIVFASDFLAADVSLRLPKREDIAAEQPAVVRALLTLLTPIIAIRENSRLSWDDYHEAANTALNGLGCHKKAALRRLRILVGQEQGLSVSRILFVLPLNYLQLLADLLALYLETQRENAVPSLLKLAA